ncbi:MAG: PHP domain-containing protein [Clostridia bacterium]|nr:PHP domain-containing protein [Clostridia bacterium]
MMFKTELHCHSKDISQCARVSRQEIIDTFVNGGYSTIALTNHLSQYTVDAVCPNDWKGFVDKFHGAYESLKNDAEGKLNILFGAELRFNGSNNDYLVFGLTKEFLYEHPDIFDLHAEKFHNLAKENNMLFIQAHPFRNWMMVIEPRMIDGVEVFNGHFGHDSRNEIANMWAEKYNLIKTSGTDYHYITSPANGGIFTDDEITDMAQLVEILKSGSYKLNRDC